MGTYIYISIFDNTNIVMTMVDTNTSMTMINTTMCMTTIHNNTYAYIYIIDYIKVVYYI